MNPAFEYCNRLVKDFEAVIAAPLTDASSVYFTGIDLGTAYVVLAVLDAQRRPIAGAYRAANVVKDGMLVDYIGAVRIVRELKQELEQQLGTELVYAAAALPPGTQELDAGAIKHVVQGAGFELTNLLDEPTAANAVLNLTDGAIVDIGGGTTGIAVFQNGKVVYVADEPTGGFHFSLVVAGAYKLSLEDAEQYKQDRRHHVELLPVVQPVIDKIATIIISHIKPYPVQSLYLVGGTCCLDKIEERIARLTGLPTYKPQNPLFITPLGIALNCSQNII